MKHALPIVALTLSLLDIVAPVKAGESDVRPLTASDAPAPFAYIDSPQAMPNYLAGEKWSTQGKSITRMQAPLSPEQSAQRMVSQPGFSVQLWAAEPNIVKPIALAWDERGRLWIAETTDYPNGLKPNGEGNDRIKICEDSDGDGKADTFKVFADRLSVPTSLCFGNGGLIVIESGRTLFLKDNDGDDVADERRVLFEGWETRDTHATASNLRYGPDNWIWGTVGYSGFDGVVGGKSHQFGQGVFRFRPDGSELEFVKSSNNNTWGLGITEEGLIVGSTANGNASWYMPIPNRYYESVKGWAANRMETVADSQRIYPVTDKVRQVDWHHQYTAGAGHAIYTARSFPEEYWNRVSFVAEPTGHLVGFFKLGSEGADRTATNLGSFLASDDEWTAPIVAEVGPDGALWVIDWYNYIIQHNPTPIGFETGKGNAYETELRDKKHGRIYRVVYEGGVPSKAYSLRADNPESWIQALRSDNQLWRMHGQRLIVERGRGNEYLRQRLLELIADPSVDSLGLNGAVQQGLWALQGLGLVESDPETRRAAERLLDHPSAAIRLAAARVLPKDREAVVALAETEALFDKDAQVRLAAYLVIAETPASAEAVELLIDSLKDPLNFQDRWLRDGAASAMAANAEGVLLEALKKGSSLPENADTVFTIVGRHFSIDAPDKAIPIIVRLDALPQPCSAALLAGFLDGWPTNQIPKISSKRERELERVMRELSPAGQDNLLALAGKWGRRDLFLEAMQASTNRLTTILKDSSAADSVRTDAARKLIEISDKPDNARLTLEQINFHSSPRLLSGLLQALRGSRLPETGALVLEKWGSFSPAQKNAAMDALLTRSDWMHQTLDAVEAGIVASEDLGVRRWSVLRNHPDQTLASRSRELLEKAGSGSGDGEAILKAYLPVLDRSGDQESGREIFASACIVCHMYYGEGTKIGPDLSGIGARSKIDVLTAILDPNRSVESNYRLWTVVTNSGNAIAGRLDAETQTSIDLYDLTGMRHSIQRSEIKSLTSSEVSIMPSGFESLGEQGLADLLAYLSSEDHGSN